MTIALDKPTTRKLASSYAMYANTGNGIEYMPDRGWSKGRRTQATRIERSNVHYSTFHTMTASEHYSDYIAEVVDSLGVTADQFFEAWNLMGDKSFELADLIYTQGGINRVSADIADISATKDMRYAYALLGLTLGATMAEAVPVAKRLGYDYFFKLATTGMSLDAIQTVDSEDIDSYLMDIILNS